MRIDHAAHSSPLNHYLLSTFQRLRNGDLFMLESHITVSQDLAWVRANVDDLTAFVAMKAANRRSKLGRRMLRSLLKG